jgi:hypothetical protein
MINQEYHKVVVDDLRTANILQHEPFVALKARDLIEALKKHCNHLLLDHSRGTISHGCFMLHLNTYDLYNQTKIVIIPWDQLEHFVQGE